MSAGSGECMATGSPSTAALLITPRRALTAPAQPDLRALSADLDQALGANKCLSSRINFTVLHCGVENEHLTVPTGPEEPVCLRKMIAWEETLNSHTQQIL